MQKLTLMTITLPRAPARSKPITAVTEDRQLQHGKPGLSALPAFSSPKKTSINNKAHHLSFINVFCDEQKKL